MWPFSPILVATCPGEFLLYTRGSSPPINSWRIYRGSNGSIVLTVTVTESTGPNIEILVNGNPITDGTMRAIQHTSRTFKLSNVQIVDLVLNEAEHQVKGTYLITVSA